MLVYGSLSLPFSGRSCIIRHTIGTTRYIHILPINSYGTAHSLWLARSLASYTKRSFTLDTPLTRRLTCNKQATVTTTAYKPIAQKSIVKTTITKRIASLVTQRALATNSHNSDNNNSSPQTSIKSKRPFQFQRDVLTIPNLLTTTRIAATPYLGYLILNGQYTTGLTVFALCSLTDLLDGFIARRWHMTSFVGSLLDPLADKLMMTVMTVTLSMQHLLPVPLAVLIIGRDIGLVVSAFYYRYRTLPPPFTISRYFNVGIASASVHPSMISKVNTALQVALVGVSLAYPVIGLEVNAPLVALQWTVAATTIGSGLGYVFAKNTVRSI
ncbi:CDP-alcohol phosphatidyltransferase-domain-containing protein [Syncephalis fuscata]|nr:CDP-alcohol phosphatidyltransferase-domain-containing protein [Syncephalis fuscata]